MYHYKSDATQFLDQLLADSPELAQEQLDNRHLLWDVDLKPEEQAAFKAAEIAKKPYTYYQD